MDAGDGSVLLHSKPEGVWADQAAELADNEDLLRERLKTKTFQHACGRTGIKPKTLLPRTKDQIRKLTGRPTLVSELELKLRCEAFEDERRRLLIAVLKNEQQALAKFAAKKEFEARQATKLSDAFRKQMEEEEKIIARMSQNRKKYEKVLEKENELIVDSVSTFVDKTKQFEEKHKRTKVRESEQAAEKAQRKKQREERARQRKQNMQQMQVAVLEEREAKLKAKDKKIKQFHKEKKKALVPKAERKAERAAVRASRLESAKSAHDKLQEQRRQAISRKAEQAKEVLALKAEQIASNKIRRKIEAEARKKQAERVRESKAFERAQLVDKLEARKKEKAALAEMKQALYERRKKLLREEKIRRDQWKAANELQRTITPGPGDYELPDKKIKGGVWSQFKVKSDLDIRISLGKDTPAPGHYHGETFSTLDKTGGVINRYKPKSDVEWKMYHAAQQPGPGEHPIVLALSAKAFFAQKGLANVEF